MKHLIRAVGLLIGIIFVAFILPKLLPTANVEELKPFGFYKGTDNTQEWKQTAVQYADPIRCNTCHADKHNTWTASAHKVVSCENCHGAGEKHIETGEPLVINTSKELCQTCHATVLGRPDEFPQIDPQTHGKDQPSCISCHNPHDPVISVAPVVPHDVKGREDCLLCHQTGGLKPFPANHEGRTADTCLSCHGGKAGGV